MSEKAVITFLFIVMQRGAAVSSERGREGKRGERGGERRRAL